MKPRALKSVWVVVHNEWISSVSTPAFWYSTLITPAVMVAIYVFFQWILSENPKDDWLEEEITQNWEFILENVVPDSKQQQPELVHYAVLDSSKTLAADIRANIVRNDQHQFINKILDMNDDAFLTFSEALRVDGLTFLDSLKRTREVESNSSRQQLIEQLIGFRVFDDDLLSAEDETFRTNFQNGWTLHHEVIKQVVPTLSSHFFKDLTPSQATEESIELMFASNEILGYFVIPEGIRDEMEDIEFITRPDLNRVVFLDLVNWYRTMATDVLKQQRFEQLSLEPAIQNLLLDRVEFAVSDTTVNAQNVFLSDSTFQRYFYLVLPVFMYLVLMAAGARLVANIAEEKSTKLADSLLASLSSSQLLDGKLWGTALISLTVVVIWGVEVPILLLLFGQLNLNLDHSFLELFIRADVVCNFLLFLLLLYSFYGYFVVGFTSLFSRVNNALSAIIIITIGIGFMFVFPSILVIAVFPSPVIQDLLSFFPLTMPFIMVARSGALPDWPVYTVIVCTMMACVIGSRVLSSAMFARGISDEIRISLSRRQSSEDQTKA